MKRLYLRSWSYNAAQILTELAKIVENNGGVVKPAPYTAIISNSSLFGSIKELKDRIEKLKSSRETEEIKATIKKLSGYLEDLELIDNTPITVTHTSYILFSFNGFCYCYEMSANPFLDFYYKKSQVKDGESYLKDKKSWWRDCFLSFRCTKADITEAAKLIFNMLISA